MKLRLWLITPAVALTLAACGGGGDAEKIKDIVKAVDKDPAALCDHATQKLLDQLGGDTDKCKATARGYQSEADKSKVEGDIDVKVDGDTATADFDTTDGDHTTAKFVKEDGDWKVDSTS